MKIFLINKNIKNPCQGHKSFRLSQTFKWYVLYVQAPKPLSLAVLHLPNVRLWPCQEKPRFYEPEKPILGTKWQGTKYKVKDNQEIDYNDNYNNLYQHYRGQFSKPAELEIKIILAGLPKYQKNIVLSCPSCLLL